MVTPVYVIYISTTGVRTLLRTPTRSGKRTTRRSTRSRTERGCADTLLLGAAWVLCAPPSRALGTVATAGKALNHGTTHARDTVVYVLILLVLNVQNFTL